jgi:hypothetical protein
MPVAVDMEILEAPFPDIKGTKGYGIVELNGDSLKLAYDLEKEKRPKDFRRGRGRRRSEDESFQANRDREGASGEHGWGT